MTNFKKFVISDTHFGHDKILQFEGDKRPFATVEEHDEELISRWNVVVGKRDVVYHLGDVAFKQAHTLDRVMPKLNGIKKLIMGNHDTGAIERLQRYFVKIVSVMEDKENGILFSHYPVHPSQLEFRYKYNIHGHTHSYEIDDNRYINVCCEHTGLAPVNLEELIERRIKNVTINR